MALKGKEGKKKHNRVVTKTVRMKPGLCVALVLDVPVVPVCVRRRLFDALVEFGDQEAVVDVHGVAQVYSVFLFLCTD